MTSPRDVIIAVIELQPGLIYVKPGDVRPEVGQTSLFLLRAISDWFHDHPGYTFARAESNSVHGKLQGIHVWYHGFADDAGLEQLTQVTAIRSADSSAPGSPPAVDFRVEIDPQINQRYPFKYLEALVNDAMTIAADHRQNPDTLVIVGQRGVAILCHGPSRRAALRRQEWAEYKMNAGQNAALRSWRLQPSSPFFVTHIPGNWFEQPGE